MVGEVALSGPEPPRNPGGPGRRRRVTQPGGTRRSPAEPAPYMRSSSAVSGVGRWPTGSRWTQSATASTSGWAASSRSDRRAPLRPHAPQAAAERAHPKTLAEPGKSGHVHAGAPDDPDRPVGHAGVLHIRVGHILHPASQGIEADAPRGRTVRQARTHRFGVDPAVRGHGNDLGVRGAGHGDQYGAAGRGLPGAQPGRRQRTESGRRGSCQAVAR